jgi:putative membrane protein
MSLLLRWIGSALALLLVAYLLPGLTVASFTTALVAAVVLGLVNAIIGPVLRFFSIPLRLLTLGLFSLVINAVLFGLAAWLVDGFDADGPVTVFLGAVLYGIASWGIQSVLGANKKK